MSGFGRDEMNLLVGGESEGLGTAGTALTSSRSFASQQAKKSARPTEVDIASLSTAETAAFLQRKQQQQQQKSNVGRYRTTRTLAHHQLLQEEMQQQLRQDKPKDHHGDHLGRENSDEGNEDDEDEDEAFSRNRISSNKASRRIIEPQILKRKHEPEEHSDRRRPPSSSDSDSERHRRRRRESSSGTANLKSKIQHDESSSDSDSSQDVRRQRVLRNQRQRMDEKNQQEERLPIDKEPMFQKKPTHTIEKNVEASPNASLLDPKNGRGRLPKHKGSSSDATTSSSDNDDSSSEEDSSSEDDGQVAIAKPLFVPRHRRHQILKEEQEEVVIQHTQQEKKQKEEKRAMESRALVAQVVSLSKSTDVNPADSDSEEAQAQTVLDDDDDNDAEGERDAWEIRELERLLTEIDRLQKAEAEMAEYRRRQQLTDEQAIHEDERAGRFKKPGQQLQRGGQRFFHRGAYYMDQEEWTEDDIRHKAGDYAQQATGSDKIDRRALPKVMQVKKFGFANQSKYQGLAKEDTTDKTLQSIPLVQRSKKSKSRSS